MSKLSNKLLTVFSDNQFNRTLWDALQQEYSTEEIMAQIADEIYNKKTLHMDRAVRDLKDLPIFKVRKETIKTVATFYYRLYNGGIEKVISLLADIWMKKGYEVVVFTDAQPTKDDYTLPLGVQRVIVPSFEKKPDREDFLIRARAWKKLIEKYNIDLMVYHAWLNEFLVFDEIAIKSTGIPFVLQAHGVFPIGFSCINTNAEYMTATQENTYSMCDTIIALSSVDRFWWSSLGLPCKQIYNPPPCALEEASAAPLDSKIVIWVGRFSREKQIYDALKAIKIVHDIVPDAQLWIFGKGEHEQDTIDVENYINKNQMSDYVFLKGFQVCVQPFYRQAALTLMTSQCEGFPMVAIESAFSGVPIVLYELPNLELVRKSRGISVAPQGDFHTLTTKIVELLQNEALRKERGKALLNDVMQMYSKDLGEQWREIFEFSLSEKPALLPKYQRDEASVAATIAMQHLRENFLQTYKNNFEKDEWIKHLELDVEALKNETHRVSNLLDDTSKQLYEIARLYDETTRQLEDTSNQLEATKEAYQKFFDKQLNIRIKRKLKKLKLVKLLRKILKR